MVPELDAVNGYAGVAATLRTGNLEELSRQLPLLRLLQVGRWLNVAPAVESITDATLADPAVLEDLLA
jgi:hypothetical protein